MKDTKREKKMLSLLKASPTTNDKNGNGRYRPLRKRKKQKKATNSDEFSYLKTSVDLTMKFNNTRDPIYYVFDSIENKSISQLMGDFVKDYFFEITNFVSKVTAK